MPNPTNLGLPCLLPVQVCSESGGRSRGFVTRLSEVSACISSSPELEVGDSVELTIRRPADNQTVVLSATVERQLKEGGLWRGRSAALVTLTSALDKHFLGTDSAPKEDVTAVPLRRGSEPIENTPYRPSRTFSAPLLSGLGRRRRPRTPGRPKERRPTDPAVSTSPVIAAGPPPRAEQAISSSEDNVPAPLRLQLGDEVSATLSPFSSGALELPDLSEALLGALADEEGGAPLDIPEGPIVLSTTPTSHDPSQESLDGLESLELSQSMEFAPPVRESTEFWDNDSWASGDNLESLDESVIPRAARIPSGVPVHFWTRGQRLGATARNFSAEGMFLAYDDVAPARGATVRVEFAVGDTRPNAAIRFTAEVRWHHGDRPGSGLPDGYGVLIREFETAGDQRRYSKLLLYLLSIDTTAPPQHP